MTIAYSCYFQIANMQYEDSESEEGSEGEEGIDKDDPLWALFSFIRYYKTNSGNSLAEPFLSLPSKRELPDYYVTIPNPISLNVIRKKLKASEYGTDIEKLYEDFTTMFANCKTYNRPDSRLFKDACRLQKLLKNKYEDLETESEEDSSEEEEEEGTPTPEEQTSPSTTASGINEINKKMRLLYDTLLKYKSPAGKIKSHRIWMKWK